MWAEFLAWLNALPQSSASFFGSLTGAALGLCAIIVGALFNAWLNRRRDDRLRRVEAQTLATALTAELSVVKECLIEIADGLERGVQNDFQVTDMYRTIRILPEMLPKLGLLGHDAVTKVVKAYGVLENYTESCVRMGGSVIEAPGPMRLIQFPGSKASEVARMNRLIVAGVLDGGLDALDHRKKHVFASMRKMSLLFPAGS
ncbi:hypothetical protein ACVMGC_005953 [Bradyrhizobium barranii subsp. barranii]